MCQVVLKTLSFPSLTEERKVGCERFETKNAHKSKDKTHMYEDMKPKRYQKLWNLHWALRTAWQKIKDSRWKCPGDECWWTGSDNMWRLSRLHGFIFWGILCCKFFFFFYFTFLHTKKHQDGKHYQRLKEQTLSVTFPNTDSVKALVFLCFSFCFYVCLFFLFFFTSSFT